MLSDENKKRARAEGWDIFIVYCEDGRLRHVALPLNFATSKMKNHYQLVQALVARATVGRPGDPLATEALKLMGTPVAMNTRKKT